MVEKVIEATNAEATANHYTKDQPVIQVTSLTKRYRGAEVDSVDNISFSVRSGALFALLGPNGAGKTTTISILTTMLLPTAGEVSIAGHNVVSEAGLVRKDIGIIFQKPSLDLHLTAEENVRFHAMLYGLFPFRPSYSMMPQAYQREIQELAELLGIRDFLFRPMKQFSGGMKRKLELLRSLLHKPRVLFLDEPTTGLDPVSRRNLWEYLHYIQTTHGTTIFLTTHYLEEAEHADAICIINKGKIVAQGTPLQVKKELTAEYVLLDAEDSDLLRQELQRHGLVCNGPPPFRLPLSTPALQRLLQSLQTTLTRIETHTPSLEDAYLEIVGA